MIKTFVFLTTLLFSSLSFGYSWKHLKLITAEGVRIELDYEIQGTVTVGANCYKCHMPAYASPLWIHVKHENLKHQDQVRVVLLNYKKSPWLTYETVSSREIDLEYMGAGTFSKETEALEIHTLSYMGTQTYRQEIAVVINGKWLKNSLTNMSNLSFNLLQ